MLWYETQVRNIEIYKKTFYVFINFLYFTKTKIINKNK